MVTKKRTIREPLEPSGVIGIGQAAEKYQLHKSSIRNWVRSGAVEVAKGADRVGDQVLLNERSLRSRLSAFQAHSASGGKSRRAASVAIDLPTELVIDAGTQHSSIPLAVQFSLPSGPWLDLYKRQKQARLSGKTLANYVSLFGMFQAQFPNIPIGDPVDARRRVMSWVEGLTSAHTGLPIVDNTKRNYLTAFTTFYRWLHREYGFNVPDLTGAQLRIKRENAVTILPWQARKALAHVRNSSEALIIMLLVQNGLRRAEMCTIRPELVHDGFVEKLGPEEGRTVHCYYVEIWGKPTNSNESGYRQVPLTSECYRALQDHFAEYGELCWENSYGRAIPLAGPIEQAGNRPIDLNENRSLTTAPKSFIVREGQSSKSNVRQALKTAFEGAGIDQLGMGAHSFRRGFSDEYLTNGGRSEYKERILGHLKVADMSDLYFNTTIVHLWEEHERCAPRAFLREEPPPQGELAL